MASAATPRTASAAAPARPVSPPQHENDEDTKRPAADAAAAHEDLMDALRANDIKRCRALLATAAVASLNACSARHGGMTALSLAAHDGKLTHPRHDRCTALYRPFFFVFGGLRHFYGLTSGESGGSCSKRPSNGLPRAHVRAPLLTPACMVLHCTL